MIAGRSPESIEKQLAIHRHNPDHLSEQRAKYGEKIPVSDLTFDRLLDDIARQCHLPDLVKQSPGKRMQSIQGLLAARPVMIV